jgi:Kef-type K+ transport system membrane component KefB
MADALLIKTLVVIFASVSAISLVARARLPAAGGYLLAGLVIGPHGLQLIGTSDETRFLAELGIIFLMFMVTAVRLSEDHIRNFLARSTSCRGFYLVSIWTQFDESAVIFPIFVDRERRRELWPNAIFAGHGFCSVDQF